METINKMVKKFSSSFLITLAILAGIWVAFAAWTASETEWGDWSFDDGDSITNNMLASTIMWYTKDGSWNKVYWKKFDWTSRSLNDASNFCMSKGMELPTCEQMRYYWAYGSTYKWYDYSWWFVNFSSMSSPWSYHWCTWQYRTFSSCSTPGYTCWGWYVTIPNSRSSNNNTRWYSTYQTVCVYKQR